MELNSVDRVVPVLNAHDLDFGCKCRDYKPLGDRILICRKGMISCYRRLSGAILKEFASVRESHYRLFAVHKTFRICYRSAVRSAYGLMSETYTECRDLLRNRLCYLDYNARVLGSSGTG